MWERNKSMETEFYKLQALNNMIFICVTYHALSNDNIDRRYIKIKANIE